MIKLLKVILYAIVLIIASLWSVFVIVVLTPIIALIANICYICYPNCINRKYNMEQECNPYMSLLTIIATKLLNYGYDLLIKMLR